MRTPVIGQPAPEIEVSTRVQGAPARLSMMRGEVVLIEVFQVNCPGCFVHALPAVAGLYAKYADQGLRVVGLATAFEDFDRNTLENLERLLATGELQGDPHEQLGRAGLLADGRLDYALPFAMAMDQLVECTHAITDAAVEAFILEQLPDYAEWSPEHQLPVYARTRRYFESRTHIPQTFTRYGLQGTPSSILIDRDGLLCDITFGWNGHLESLIKDCL